MQQFFLSEPAARRTAEAVQRVLGDGGVLGSTPPEGFVGYTVVLFKLTSDEPDDDGFYDGVLCRWNGTGWTEGTTTVKVFFG